jgi:hypothetical protein
MTSKFRFFQRISVWLMLTALLGLTVACAAAAPTRQAVDSNTAGSAPAQKSVMPMPAATAAAPAQPALSYSGETSVNDILSRTAADALAAERVIVYTGQMILIVKDTGEAVTAITKLAKDQNGYVAGSNLYQAGDATRGSITLRIPAEKYEDTLVSLRALAKRVERENSNTQDVTEEFVDLQARQTNLEVTEKALQQLLEERKRVGSTADILEVYRELTSVRGQIEQIQGRLRFLSNQAALSTLTIELIPDVLSQPVSVAGWEPQGTAKEALQALVLALQGLINLLIWVVIFILPLLLIMLIPVVVVVVIIRAWWKRRKVQK